MSSTPHDQPLDVVVTLQPDGILADGAIAGRSLVVRLGRFKGGYLVSAECKDERTEVIVLEGGRALPMPDPNHLDETLLAHAALQEHVMRCLACQAWMNGELADGEA